METPRHFIALRISAVLERHWRGEHRYMIASQAARVVPSCRSPTAGVLRFGADSSDTDRKLYRRTSRRVEEIKMEATTGNTRRIDSGRRARFS